MKRNRIVVGFPLVEVMLTKFFAGWLAHTRELARVVDWYPIIGSTVHDAHNAVIARALERPRSDWDYLLFIEQDHVFPPGWFARVEGWTEEIVGALYCLRTPPHQPCCMLPVAGPHQQAVWRGREWSLQTLRYPTPRELREWMPAGELRRAVSVGMGCTAIRRDVLEAWPKDEPPFQVPWTGKAWDFFTDDVYFCRTAAERGVKVWVDFGLHIGHLAQREIDLGDRYRWLEDEAVEQGLLVRTVVPARPRAG